MRVELPPSPLIPHPLLPHRRHLLRKRERSMASSLTKRSILKLHVHVEEINADTKELNVVINIRDCSKFLIAYKCCDTTLPLAVEHSTIEMTGG